jgi:FAD-dependent oxidoreductase family protein
VPVHVTAHARTWKGFLAKERSLLAAVIRQKIRVKGNLSALLAFGKCFPTAGPGHEKVERNPQPSRMRANVVRCQRNDPATGKIRWLWKLWLAEIENVAHNVKTFRLKPSEGKELPFDHPPGQFLALHASPQDTPVKRSYTIASTPKWRDRIEITVKREPHGLVSRWLHDEIKVVDEVLVAADDSRSLTPRFQ